MNPQVMKLLRESAEWRLIALLFEPPVSGWHERVTRLAAEVGDATLSAAALKAGTEATEILYHTTFGPGGPAAPREVSYGGRVMAGQLLGEVTGFYRAFAYDPALHETPDHVAVEAGFVAYLRLKQAYALERGETDQVQLCAEAAEHFIALHLSAIAEPLAASLEASGIRYLAFASTALLKRVGPRKHQPALPTAPEPCIFGAEGCSWSDDSSDEPGAGGVERWPAGKDHLEPW